MKTRSLNYATLILFACTLNASCQPKSPEQTAISENPKAPIGKSKGFAVLELFTSQGCSSCPPADAILGKYATQNNPEIIPLAFHVDYWDRLGWKDPYSKKEYTERQQEYASILGSSVYTPQIVINGANELVGSQGNTIAGIVDNQLESSAETGLTIVSAVVKNNQVEVNYKLEGAGDIINAALVRKQETTTIKRGENGGRKLTGYNIVIEFSREKIKKEGTIVLPFDSRNTPSDHKIIIYCQQTDGKITGVSQSEIQ